MVSRGLPCAGLLAGVAAKGQRREHMQLLADCQRVYCEARLMLVADVVAARMAEYCREPLPSLTRSGCSYLMQVCVASSCTCMWQADCAIKASLRGMDVTFLSGQSAFYQRTQTVVEGIPLMLVPRSDISVQGSTAWMSGVTSC